MENGYLSESTQRELSNEYQHDMVWMVFKKSLHSGALNQSSLSIGKVNASIQQYCKLHALSFWHWYHWWFIVKGVPYTPFYYTFNTFTSEPYTFLFLCKTP